MLCVFMVYREARYIQSCSDEGFCPMFVVLGHD